MMIIDGYRAWRGEELAAAMEMALYEKEGYELDPEAELEQLPLNHAHCTRYRGRMRRIKSRVYAKWERY